MAYSLFLVHGNPGRHLLFILWTNETFLLYQSAAICWCYAELRTPCSPHFCCLRSYLLYFTLFPLPRCSSRRKSSVTQAHHGRESLQLISVAAKAILLYSIFNDQLFLQHHVLTVSCFFDLSGQLTEYSVPWARRTVVKVATTRHLVVETDIYFGNK